MTKPPLQMVPHLSLVGVSRTLEFGAKADKSSSRCTSIETLLGKALRHLTACQAPDGSWPMTARDVESGLPELDHAICNLLLARVLLIKQCVLPADPACPDE